jgi:hypothetical protein
MNSVCGDCTNIKHEQPTERARYKQTQDLGYLNDLRTCQKMETVRERNMVQAKERSYTNGWYSQEWLAA